MWKELSLFGVVKFSFGLFFHPIFLGNDFSDEEIHKILGILGVNSFVVHDGGSDEANTDLVKLIKFDLSNLPKELKSEFEQDRF